MRLKLRKDWKLGFFGFFAIFALPGILKGDWLWAVWFVWVIWFMYFIPTKQ